MLALFGESGSRLIGCQQPGCKACLMGLDPLSSDVIVQRWEQFTGKTAERAGASSRRYRMYFRAKQTMNVAIRAAPRTASIAAKSR